MTKKSDISHTLPTELKGNIEMSRVETPVLLLGASGFLGPALAEAFGSTEILNTYCRHLIPGGLFFDVRRTKVAALIDGLAEKPETAIVLLGNTAIDECARDPAGTAEVNVHGIVRVIDELRVLGITPVFVSSDAVFDGSRAFWREVDMPKPILEYGRQKLQIESYLSSLPSPWLIVRLPKLLSKERNSRCMLNGWIETLGREDRILCATDQYFTPAFASDVAQGIVRLVRAHAQGIYHLGGPQRLNRRELLELVVTEYRKFAVPRAEIVNCLLHDIPVLEPRPLDNSLSSSRFEHEFNYRFCDLGSIVTSAVTAYFSTDKRIR